MKKTQQESTAKKVLKIVGKTLLGIFLTIYIVVALANYSVVQSIAGSWASSYLSKETGGEIHIGSIGIGLLNHVRLHNVLLCAPNGDTIFDIERISVAFDGIPISSDGLNLRRVSIRNGYYFLGINEDGFNLKFLIDYFKSEKKEKKVHKDFVIRSNSVSIHNLRYKMHLKNWDEHHPEHGISPKDMDYSDIDIRMRNVRVLNDHITLKMESMTAKERSGLHLKNFSGFVYVTPYGISVTDMDVETDASHLMGDVMLRYNGWHDMGNYISNVHMLADFKEGSVGSIRDAAYWAPVLWPMDQKVELSGLFYGPVADMHANNVSLAFGKQTRLTLNGYITGLADIKNTIINGQVTDMTTCFEDWQQIRMPTSTKAVQIPQKIAALMPLQITEASLIGTIDEFMATAQMQTHAGDIAADAIMQKDTKTNDYQYVGNIKSDNFALHRVLPNNYVSSLGFDVTLQGSGLDPDSIQLLGNAIMHNIRMHTKNIDYAELNAEINGRSVEADLHIEDPLAEAAISAAFDLGQGTKNYSATANISSIDLAQLKIINTDNPTTTLSSQATINLQGSTFDELVGSIVLNNTTLSLPDRDIKIDQISVLSQNFDNYKNLSLDCDLLRFSAKGYFKYSDFKTVAQKLCNLYVPVYHNPFHGTTVDTDTAAKDHVNDFSFELAYMDSLNTLGSIVPGLSMATGTTLSGRYDDVELLQLWLHSDSVRYGSLVANNINIGGRGNGSQYLLSANADNLLMGSAASLQNLAIGMESYSSGANLNVDWNDKSSQPSQGDLNINLQSNPQYNIVTLLNSSFAVNGEQWNVADHNQVTYGPHLFTVDNLHVKSLQQSLSINGYVSPDSTDAITVDFDEFDISSFNLLLDEIGLSMTGSLDGNIAIKDFHKTIYYDANIDIEDWQINDRGMGNAKILSRWDADKKRIGVLLTSVMSEDTLVRYPINMNGFYYPEDDGRLDFHAAFNGFDLKSVAPYLKSFSSQFEGGLHGTFAVNGTLKQPRVSGEAVFENGLLKLDMFNTVYRFSDTLFFENNQILLKDFEFNDAYNNTAKINGTVSHNYFKDFAVDASLVSDNIMVMNTTPKNAEYYYGSVFATVNGTVKGPVNNLSVVANATTNPGSAFSIPLSDKQQISEQNFIRFIPKERRTGTGNRQTSNNMRYKVLVNIAANSNVRLSMPMDFSQLTAMVSATGNGNLQLNIASGNNFSMSGDYIIQSGSFKIDFLDLMSRELTLEEGSSLSWTGSPTNANIDITGVYAQRVNMTSLYAGQESVDHTSKTVNVESIIALSGQLLNPTIKFDFRLPNADQSTEEEVFAIIDRTNEREMINQTVSLLTMSQFYSPSTNSGSFNPLSSGLGIAANTVSSVVSSMVEFVDVNINYKTGDELITNQLDIDISKEWKRFYFETTFGIGGDARTLNQLDDGSASTIIGDVLVGYKISPNFHLVAFNRSNANDYTKQDMPYTQGVGIKYSHDFDTWKSLLTPKRKKTATKKAKKK